MVRIALCQTNVLENKKINLENAYDEISNAAKNGAKLISLGEMFNCPYSGSYFNLFAEEEEKSPTLDMFKRVCREWRIYLIGGSIPELDSGKVYNTSYVIDPEGSIIAKYRKIHMFDIDIKDGISFFESSHISPGDTVGIFDTPFGRMGLCICYDIRFPELVRTMALRGVQMVFVPAAFNMTTGPAHWETIFKARAIDNQIYIAGISPARNYDGVYTAYGHSLVVNPWGEIVSRAQELQSTIYADIDMDFIGKIREQMPLLKHRKPQIYTLD